MPAPTCYCIVCETQTSKRQSLSIEFNGKKGRACRTHPEVAESLKEKFESATNKKLLQEAEENIRVMSLVTFISVQRFVNPLFLTEYYLHKVGHNYGKNTEALVRKELEAKPPLMPEDVATSIMLYSTLMQKKLK